MSSHGMVSLLRQNVANVIFDSLQSSSSSFLLPGPKCSRQKLASLVSHFRPDKKTDVDRHPQCLVDVAQLVQQGVLSSPATPSQTDLHKLHADLRRAIQSNLETYHYEGISLHNETIGDPAEALTSTNSSSTQSTSLSSSSPSLSFNYDKTLFIAHVLNDVLTSRGYYGSFSNLHSSSSSSASSKPKISFEFSSPNIAKPFHVGHLRSTILGNSLSKINSFVGVDVTRINYLGDWGTQFGLMAVGLQMFGDEELREDLGLTFSSGSEQEITTSSPSSPSLTYSSSSTSSSPSSLPSSNSSSNSTNSLTRLMDIYVKVNDLAEKDESIRSRSLSFFSSMERGDPTALQTWSSLRRISVSELDQIYSRLDVDFDLNEGESKYGARTEVFKQRLLAQGLLVPSDKPGMEGTLVLNLPDASPSSSSGRAVPLFKSDSSSLYLTRDIMAAESRFRDFRFNKMYYLVEQGQRVHFENLIDAINLLHPYWNNSDDSLIEHLPFGRISGMSTRKGNVILLDEVLDEAYKRVRDSLDATPTTKAENRTEASRKLSIGAIMIQDLEKYRRYNYKFSWEKALDFRRESGVTLQYAHARLCSIERTFDCHDWMIEGRKAAELLVRDPDAFKLLQILASFDEALHAARLNHEPSTLVRYLYDVMHLTNKAFRTLPVKAVVDSDLGVARIMLFRCAKIVLANGMKLLGVDPLEMM